MGSFFSRLFGKQEMKILMNGLDAAGKTTILYRLKLGETVTTIPTIGFNVETIEYKNIKFVAWDIGGRGKMRALYRHYYPGVGAFFFVIDSNDKERMEEVKEELHTTVQQDELRDCIFVILANKQDLPGALKPHEIEEKMDTMTVRKTHTCEVFGTTGTTGEGLYEVLDWLSCAVAQKSASGLLRGNEKLTKNTAKTESKSTYFTAPFLYLKKVFSKV